MWVEVIGEELGAFSRSSKVGFIKSELMIFKIPTKTTAAVAISNDTAGLTWLLSAYHLISKPVIDKCQMSKISTSRVSVFFRANITTLTISMMSKKYKVHGEPQVIVAKGAHPTSVILSWIPVFSTNFASEAEKAPFSMPMIAPIPVKAMASLIPPSSALENFTPNKSARTVKIINMTIGPPILIMGSKNLFAISMIAFIKNLPIYFYFNPLT